MPARTAPAEPPPIPGVGRSYVSARGVDFHVTEAGDPGGAPVLCLHGWPQHHYAWRALLSDPPAGVRIIAPDLPGYGWSGPAPHAWAKEDVASDVLALCDALGVEQMLLVGHDWGGYVGHLLALRAPERFSGYLALNIAHPWQTPRTLLPHVWRFLAYQPALAAAGEPLMRRTGFVHALIKGALSDKAAMSEEDIRWFADRFRDPVVARTARDTYRTFWMREVPASARNAETRRSRVPTRALFGTGDVAIHVSLAAAETANADDYTLERVAGCGHFIADERPDLIRARVIELAGETQRLRA
jgi:pimeloyl-ACP methyl ester carboxylesterase